MNMLSCCRMTISGWLFAALCGAGLWAPARAATSYVFETASFSTTSNSIATDINNSGVVVGYSYDNTSGVSSAFVYAAGSGQSVAGPPGAVSTDLTGISDAGVMFGNYSNTLVDDGTGTLVPGPTQIFSFNGTTYKTYSIPGLLNPYADAVSPNGRWIVGIFNNARGTTSAFAFDSAPGGAITLIENSADLLVAAGVNNSGLVAGYDRTFVTGVGNIGPGWIFNVSTGVRGDIVVAGSARVAARDISATGIVSGYYYDNPRSGPVHGYTGYPSGLQIVDVPGAVMSLVEGANDSGALVGQFAVDNTGAMAAFVARPVPEPASVALCLAGLAGLAGWSRRKRSPPAIAAMPPRP